MSEPTTTGGDSGEIAARVELVKRLMPEFVPFFRELYLGGMVEGWRNLERVDVLADDAYAHDGSPDERGV